MLKILDYFIPWWLVAIVAAVVLAVVLGLTAHWAASNQKNADDAHYLPIIGQYKDDLLAAQAEQRRKDQAYVKSNLELKDQLHAEVSSRDARISDLSNDAQRLRNQIAKRTTSLPAGSAPATTVGIDVPDTNLGIVAGESVAAYEEVVGLASDLAIKVGGLRQYIQTSCPNTDNPNPSGIK